MIKILTVVGARPQFVKAAVVSSALSTFENIREVMVHTGQHYDSLMSEVFFKELDMHPPKYNLAIGSGGQGEQTGRMMAALEPVIIAEKPDVVVVYGDTNSTMAGALVAAKLHVPVAHVEAGLRSFNIGMPEEVNRIVTDHVSRWLFAPTSEAVCNLKNEGITAENIRLVGDVMFDAALKYVQDTRAAALLDRLDIRRREYVLATIHRAENTDDGTKLRKIFKSLSAIGARCPVVLPLHPRTRMALERMGLTPSDMPKIRFLDPLGYIDMLALEKNARTIVTDSGGVQKEAFFFKVPCVIVRSETEWGELVKLGGAVLVSADQMIDAVFDASFDIPEGTAATLYGGGVASNRIATEIDRMCF